MKYTDKYPNAIKDDEPEHMMWNCGESEPCGVCGTPTPYISISWEGYLCSEECNQKHEDDLIVFFDQLNARLENEPPDDVF